MSDRLRTETDTMGSVVVPAEALWGAQTQRSLNLFHISTETMPMPLLMSLARIKRACALVNAELGLLDTARAQAIAQAAQEVLNGEHEHAFPLSVWQTGSGTHTHMNMNEVLAHRATELLDVGLGDRIRIDAHDHVNLGQSSNDVFPTAMHMAAMEGISEQLLPALLKLRNTLSDKASALASVIKVGRTHLQDATPLTFGQEVSGWVSQLDHANRGIIMHLDGLYELAIGGTAVGTGLNTHRHFGARVSARLASEMGYPFTSARNHFAAQAAHDAMVSAHSALKGLAVALIKIANDVRWLASGPRCGLGELTLPANEPGSSIMPGKVNPSQCEALIMACYQIMGNDVTIGLAGASGHFELNTCKPLIAHDFLQSVRLLSDAITSFDLHCARGMEPNLAKLAEQISQSLMMVTALSPHIGYDRAATIAMHAHQSGGSLREAALALHQVSAQDFDNWVRPEKMI